MLPPPWICKILKKSCMRSSYDTVNPIQHTEAARGKTMKMGVSLLYSYTKLMEREWLLVTGQKRE